MKLLTPLIAIAVVIAVAATAAAQDYSEEFDFGSEPYDFSWDAIAPDPKSAHAEYDVYMARGDQYAMEATQYATKAIQERFAPTRLEPLIQQAVAAYEGAIETRPDEPDPYYRAGLILDTFYGRTGTFRPSVGVEVLRYWHELERLVPLDPRVTGILFQRAITHTRMATDEHLRLGIDDYETLMQRRDLNTLLPEAAGNQLNNLAEMYMMVGELGTAIPLYHRALAYWSDVSFAFGLAVALDRDEQGVKAREVMATYITSFGSYLVELETERTFYVPDGEKFYYLGMAYEALGQYDEAIASFQAFIDSGAHPRFHARAKDDIADIRVKKAKQIVAPKPVVYEF